VVADADLVGMPEHHVLSEDHAPPARSEQQWVERLPKPESQCARHVLRRQHDRLVPEERAPARTPDDEICVLLPGRPATVEELILGSGNLAQIHPSRLYHSSERRMPSRKPTCGL